jgi:catechol 2,3-dioxygenase-like lactoylglutathione lyase family enzyme
MKLGHIALSVSSIDQAAEFYRKHFGFERSQVFDLKSAGFKIAILRKDDIALELFEYEEHQALPESCKTLDRDLRILGVKHFSLEVKGLQKVRDELGKAGVEFAGEICTFEDGRKYFFIKDLDGILIEIMEEKK